MVATFQEMYDETGDAEAYGLSRLFCKYGSIACLYMLCDVLHTLAKLQGSLQSQGLNLACVPAMVEGTIARLKELKEMLNTSTWFKDHVSVFSDPQQLGGHNILIAEDEKEEFLRRVYRPYIQSVIDHISNRLMSSDINSHFLVFDPRLLPDNEEDLSSYGELKMNVLTTFYGRAQSVSFEGQTNRSVPDVDGDEARADRVEIFS